MSTLRLFDRQHNKRIFLKNLQNAQFWSPTGPNKSTNDFLKKLCCYFLDMKVL